MSIESLTADDHGEYRLTTLTGSIYELVLHEPKLYPAVSIGTLRRLPDQVPAADGGAQSEPMRRDGNALRVIGAEDITVGTNGFFTLEALGDGESTVRRTSIIQSIVKV